MDRAKAIREILELAKEQTPIYYIMSGYNSLARRDNYNIRDDANNWYIFFPVEQGVSEQCSLKDYGKKWAFHVREIEDF